MLIIRTRSRDGKELIRQRSRRRNALINLLAHTGGIVIVRVAGREASIIAYFGQLYMPLQLSSLDIVDRKTGA